MRKRSLHKTILYVMICLISILCLAGCSLGKDGETESQQTEIEGDANNELFLIVDHDMQEETISICSLESGLEYCYEYGFSTRFKDKYGSISPAVKFTSGRVVTIAPRDKDGYLTEVQLSDQVWEYEKVRRFNVNEETGVFTIADTKYSIQHKVKVFSDGKEIGFSDISKDDILTVVGMDR